MELPEDVELLKRIGTFAEVPVDRAAAYCGADSTTVLALREHFAPERIQVTRQRRAGRQQRDHRR